MNKELVKDDRDCCDHCGRLIDLETEGVAMVFDPPFHIDINSELKPLEDESFEDYQQRCGNVPESVYVDLLQAAFIKSNSLAEQLCYICMDSQDDKTD